MKKIIFLIASILCRIVLNAQSDAENGEWKKRYVFKQNTAEADYMIRLGDIDNLGYGWEEGFNPFSGKSSNAHEWPMEQRDSTEITGFDMVMLGSSFKNPDNAKDGYAGARDYLINKFNKTTFEFAIPLKGVDTSKVKNVALQIFVDDFQAKAGTGAKFEFYMNSKRYAPAERSLNALNQTGPIGKLITVNINKERLADVKKDTLKILFDDRTSGVGDGYAIDFIKVLLNPKIYKTGSLTGTVFGTNGKPLVKATINCGNLSVTTDAFGKFTLTNVPAGLAVITVITATKKEQDFTVDVEGGINNKAELKIE